MEKIRIFVKNPYINIIVGVLFLYSGISEAVNEFDDIENLTIGAHHGIILFSMLHILKFVPDMFEGLEYIEKSQE